MTLAASGVWGVLVVPFVAAAALLCVAGVPKVRDPGNLVRAVRSVGLPVGGTAVRAFAVAETLVGAAALLAPGRVTAALLALTYAGFTVFVGLALRRGGVLDSCGCFGRADTPPTLAHLLVTAAAALTGLAVAWWPPVSAWSGAGALEVLGVLALAGLVGFLAWQVMAVLPSVDPRAVRSGSTRRG